MTEEPLFVANSFAKTTEDHRNGSNKDCYRDDDIYERHFVVVELTVQSAEWRTIVQDEIRLEILKISVGRKFKNYKQNFQFKIIYI